MRRIKWLEKKGKPVKEVYLQKSRRCFEPILSEIYYTETINKHGQTSRGCCHSLLEDSTFEKNKQNKRYDFAKGIRKMFSKSLRKRDFSIANLFANA